MVKVSSNRLAATLLLAAALTPAPGMTLRTASAQDASTAGSEQTPKQPTADDPSVGLPSEPATMSKNPEAMSPHAARDDGTAPDKAGAK